MSVVSDQCDLLVEIGTEELPPKALLQLSRDFAAHFTAALTGVNLSFASTRSFATPRRLALLVNGLSSRQPEQNLVRRGPALAAAFDADGCPTSAALGFARSCGVDVAQLEQQTSERGAWLIYRNVRVGRSTKALLPELLETVLADLPIPKRMRWGAGEQEFVRPVHWLVLMLDDEVVPASIFGISSGRETRGHRFHHPVPLSLAKVADYEPRLKQEGCVVPDFAERRALIQRQVAQTATSLDAQARVDPALLDEVTALVEWPVAIAGSFDPRYLALPKEVLVSTLQEHQKYFPIVDDNDELKPNFITICGIESRDPTVVKHGNERVVRPRLADAEFFWKQDLRTPLGHRRSALAHVTFESRLGTLLDKTERVTRLAQTIAVSLAMPAAEVKRAASLCKCDLVTQMVYEFPELQGIMGRHYAIHSNEPVDVAQALEQYYWPRFAGDRIPTNRVALPLALADRLDTLVGIFAIGENPTGNRDPFGLRRNALAVLRILVEGELNLALHPLLASAAQAYPEKLLANSSLDSVKTFMLDRLQSYYSDQGFQPDEFDAVQSVDPERPLDFHARIRALASFRRLDDAASLEAANKRIRNILRRADDLVPNYVDSELLTETPEQQLAAAIAQAASQTEPLMQAGNYEESLVRLAQLRRPVDHFFDEVLVMTDATEVRRNRLALLSDLQALFLRVADFSRLQPRTEKDAD